MAETMGSEEPDIALVGSEPMDKHSLSSKLGLWLRLAQRSVFRRVSANLACHNLQQVDVLILGLLRDNPGCRQISITQALQMRQPNVAKLIEGLEDMGLVERTPDPLDRRATRISLTALGLHTAAQAEIDFRRAQDSLLSGFGDESVQRLLDMLKCLAELEDDASTERRLGSPAVATPARSSFAPAKIAP